MTIVVKTFNEISKEEMKKAGGKGAALARLHQARFPVPNGFIILPNAFNDDDLRSGAWTQIKMNLQTLRKDEHSSFAVRSSALSEDSALASFAGEFETVLDVHTDEMVRAAILTVRRSRHSERVKAYVQAKGIQDVIGRDGLDIAVVVQNLVQAEVSGVLFTADPVNGSRMKMIGNFIYGLGDALVSGDAEPHTFSLHRPKGEYEGPDELKSQSRGLFKLATRLEREMQCPQDIEWCLADGKIYLLQSRPITTLREYDPVTYDWNSSYTGDYLWVSTGGIYPEVLTPSSWSYLKELFHRQIGETTYMGNIGGRLYMNASALLAIYQKLGKSKDDFRGVLNLMAGNIPEGLDFPPVPSVTIRGVLKQASPRLLMRQRRLMNAARENPVELSHQTQDLQNRVTQASKVDLINLWHDELMPLFNDRFLVLDSSNEAYSFPYNDLKNQLTKLLGEAEASAFISSIAVGEMAMANLGISSGLYEIVSGSMTREEYLLEYGHRHGNENELAVPRPNEDPDWLDKQLAELGKDPVEVDKLLRKRGDEFDALWANFENEFPKHAKSIKQRIDKLGQVTQMREFCRSEFTRVIGVIRQWYLRAAGLTGLGKEIFFLTFEEVLDLLTGDESVTKPIPLRMETYRKYCALPPYPNWIRGRFDPYEWVKDPSRRQDVYDPYSMIGDLPDSDTLQGYPGSSGIAEGIVRYLEGPDEGELLKRGEVLMAITTNIGWTPLFPRAAAVITDIGAPLAHAAIVARELGIPAVVGCGNATMRLKTGDRVRVDGGRGLVEILESTKN